MFLLNSRLTLLSATSLRRHPLNQRYGINLPSSLASILSRALGYSPRPPESVCGTVNKGTPRAAFLGSMGSLSYEAEAPPHHLSALTQRLSLTGPIESAYWLEPVTKYPAQHTLLRPCSIHRPPCRCRNINLLSIVYAFRPRLRDRLTLGGFTFPRKP